MFVFDPTVSFGNILTFISIIISVVALLISANGDRKLKKKEYADRIRQSAGKVISKLERWKEISLNFFDEIQPLFIEVDKLLTSKQNAIEARDYLWRSLEKYRADYLSRLLNEQIETAYSELYGYDPNIQNLFSETIQYLKKIDNYSHIALLERTQQQTIKFAESVQPIDSALVGNALRKVSGLLASRKEKMLEKAISSFRIEMIKIINASDNEILRRKIVIITEDFQEDKIDFQSLKGFDWESAKTVVAKSEHTLTHKNTDEYIYNDVQKK